MKSVVVILLMPLFFAIVLIGGCMFLAKIGIHLSFNGLKNKVSDALSPTSEKPISS